jgi:hypothetical protein
MLIIKTLLTGHTMVGLTCLKAKEAYRGGYGKKWGKVVQSGMLRRFKVSIGKTRKLGKFNNFRREGENGVSLIHAGFQPVNLHNN